MEDRRIKFWGIRGSTPVCEKGKRKYGGHTLCSSIETDTGDVLILDAGTGIMRLGAQIEADLPSPPSHLYLFLTHFHLDHIIGLPFFSLLYSADTHITFFSPYDVEETKKYLYGIMAERYFPIKLKDTPSQKEFRQIPKETIEINGTQISWCPLNHPQGSVAYRLEYQGKSYVMATDTEHPERGCDEILLQFCKGADMLVYDSMYTPEEYSNRKGWGHSTWLAGTELATQAGVGALYLSHLNPFHTDEHIDTFLQKAQDTFPQTFIAIES